MYRWFLALVLAFSADAVHKFGGLNVRTYSGHGRKEEPSASAVTSYENTSEAPSSIFVSVFSAQANFARRQDLRQALRHASTDPPGKVTVRFAVCNQSDAADGAPATIDDAEQGDMLILGCKEGWKNGLLTRKLVMVMQKFKQSYARDHRFFMRIDDDSFVAWRRLKKALAMRSHSYLYYLGALVPSGRAVNRDNMSPWYQPPETYKYHQYPAYMQKGPGYIVSGEIIVSLLHENIPQSRFLTNEDQAMGVWVDVLKRRDYKIKLHDLPNWDGRSATFDMLWQDYPPLLHHQLKGDCINCLTMLDTKDDAKARVADCFVDSMFVAVFSSRGEESKLRRNHARPMLANADIGGGRIITKFVLCSRKFEGPGGENPEVESQLHKEAADKGDMLFVDCEEGYGRQLLTKKLILTMQTYIDQYHNKSLFMKLDDDTFVSWRRLRRTIKDQRVTSNLYMGIPAPEGTKVNRDPTSSWFQPTDIWPSDKYPLTMEGGPGYIIGGDLVFKIINHGIALQHVLSNEDQATGVWIELLKQRGVQVNTVALPGTDGYRPQFDTCFGPWKDYPFLLHHHLRPHSISCLARLDRLNSDTEEIDGCFENCVPLTTESLKTKIDALAFKVRETVNGMKVIDSELQGMARVGSWLVDKAFDTDEVSRAAT